MSWAALYINDANDPRYYYRGVKKHGSNTAASGIGENIWIDGADDICINIDDSENDDCGNWENGCDTLGECVTHSQFIYHRSEENGYGNSPGSGRESISTAHTHRGVTCVELGNAAGQDQDRCRLCPDGMSIQNLDSTGLRSGPKAIDSACTYTCPAGTFRPANSIDGCMECPIGTYQGQGGQGKCEHCTSGTYQNQKGQTECIPCGGVGVRSCNPESGMILSCRSGYDGASCDECAYGYILIDGVCDSVNICSLPSDTPGYTIVGKKNIHDYHECGAETSTYGASSWSPSYLSSSMPHGCLYKSSDNRILLNRSSYADKSVGACRTIDDNDDYECVYPEYFSVEEVSIECAPGYIGIPSVRCPTNGGAFLFNDCAEHYCSVPDDTDTEKYQYDSMLTSGTCTYPIIDATDCQAKGVYLGLGWMGPISTWASPPGCYIQSGDYVYYNSATSSSTDCSPDMPCICDEMTVPELNLTSCAVGYTQTDQDISPSVICPTHGGQYVFDGCAEYPCSLPDDTDTEKYQYDSMLTSGECTYPITDPLVCQTKAGQQWAGVAPGPTAGLPRGCYVHSNGLVYYNTGTIDDTDCSTNMPCICDKMTVSELNLQNTCAVGYKQTDPDFIPAEGSDVNGDGTVDINDILSQLGDFGTDFSPSVTCSSTLTTGTCSQPITNAEDCQTKGMNLGIEDFAGTTTVPEYPSGCWVHPNGRVYYNSSYSDADCSQDMPCICADSESNFEFTGCTENICSTPLPSDNTGYQYDPTLKTGDCSHPITNAEVCLSKGEALGYTRGETRSDMEHPSKCWVHPNNGRVNYNPNSKSFSVSCSTDMPCICDKITVPELNLQNTCAVGYLQTDQDISPSVTCPVDDQQFVFDGCTSCSTIDFTSEDSVDTCITCSSLAITGCLTADCSDGYENYVHSSGTCSPIPVDCIGSWSEYDACSVGCGGGTQTRTYSITRQVVGTGAQCDADNGTTESQDCNTESCAICRDYTCIVGYQDPNNQTQCNGPNSNDCDDTICCQAQPTNVQCGAGQELQEGTSTSVTTCVDCGDGTFSTGGNECIDHTVTGCPDGHSYTAGTTTTDSSCTANQCTRNTTIANSNRTDSNQCLGVTDYTCAFTCNQGYRKSGEHTCQPSGTFTGGSCLANPCTNSTIENSITTCVGVTDDTCNFTCNRGYTKSGVHTCQPGGTFDGGSCSACPAGQSSSLGGLCEDCPAGQSSSLGGLCEDCPAGQTSTAGGTCTNCPSSTPFSLEGSSACEDFTSSCGDIYNTNTLVTQISGHSSYISHINTSSYIDSNLNELRNYLKNDLNIDDYHINRIFLLSDILYIESDPYQTINNTTKAALSVKLMDADRDDEGIPNISANEYVNQINHYTSGDRNNVYCSNGGSLINANINAQNQLINENICCSSGSMSWANSGTISISNENMQTDSDGNTVLLLENNHNNETNYYRNFYFEVVEDGGGSYGIITESILSSDETKLSVTVQWMMPSPSNPLMDGFTYSYNLLETLPEPERLGIDEIRNTDITYAVSTNIPGNRGAFTFDEPFQNINSDIIEPFEYQCGTTECGIFNNFINDGTDSVVPDTNTGGRGNCGYYDFSSGSWFSTNDNDDISPNTLLDNFDIDEHSNGCRKYGVTIDDVSRANTEYAGIIGEMDRKMQYVCGLRSDETTCHGFNNVIPSRDIGDGVCFWDGSNCYHPSDTNYPSDLPYYGDDERGNRRYTISDVARLVDSCGDGSTVSTDSYGYAFVEWPLPNNEDSSLTLTGCLPRNDGDNDFSDGTFCSSNNKFQTYKYPDPVVYCYNDSDGSVTDVSPGCSGGTLDYTFSFQQAPACEKTLCSLGSDFLPTSTPVDNFIITNQESGYSARQNHLGGSATSPAYTQLVDYSTLISEMDGTTGLNKNIKCADGFYTSDSSNYYDYVPDNMLTCSTGFVLVPGDSCNQTYSTCLQMKTDNTCTGSNIYDTTNNDHKIDVDLSETEITVGGDVRFVINNNFNHCCVPGYVSLLDDDTGNIILNEDVTDTILTDQTTCCQDPGGGSDNICNTSSQQYFKIRSGTDGISPDLCKEVSTCDTEFPLITEANENSDRVCENSLQTCDLNIICTSGEVLKGDYWDTTLSNPGVDDEDDCCVDPPICGGGSLDTGQPPTSPCPIDTHIVNTGARCSTRECDTDSDMLQCCSEKIAILNNTNIAPNSHLKIHETPDEELHDYDASSIDVRVNDKFRLHPNTGYQVNSDITTGVYITLDNRPQALITGTTSNYNITYIDSANAPVTQTPIMVPITTCDWSDNTFTVNNNNKLRITSSSGNIEIPQSNIPGNFDTNEYILSQSFVFNSGPTLNSVVEVSGTSYNIDDINLNEHDSNMIVRCDPGKRTDDGGTPDFFSDGVSFERTIDIDGTTSESIYNQIGNGLTGAGIALCDRGELKFYGCDAQNCNNSHCNSGDNCMNIVEQSTILNGDSLNCKPHFEPNSDANLVTDDFPFTKGCDSGSGFEYFISAVISDTPGQRKFYSKEDLTITLQNQYGGIFTRINESISPCVACDSGSFSFDNDQCHPNRCVNPSKTGYEITSGTSSSPHTVNDLSVSCNNGVDYPGKYYSPDNNAEAICPRPDKDPSGSGIINGNFDFNGCVQCNSCDDTTQYVHTQCTETINSVCAQCDVCTPGVDYETRTCGESYTNNRECTLNQCTLSSYDMDIYTIQNTQGNPVTSINDLSIVGDFTISCNAGFLEGDSASLTCPTNNGSFNISGCEAQTCSTNSINVIGLGSHNCSEEQTTGSSCNFQCTQGYYGGGTLTCGTTGALSITTGTTGSCTRCPDNYSTSPGVYATSINECKCEFNAGNDLGLVGNNGVRVYQNYARKENSETLLIPSDGTNNVILGCYDTEHQHHTNFLNASTITCGDPSQQTGLIYDETSLSSEDFWNNVQSVYTQGGSPPFIPAGHGEHNSLCGGCINCAPGTETCNEDFHPSGICQSSIVTTTCSDYNCPSNRPPRAGVGGTDITDSSASQRQNICCQEPDPLNDPPPSDCQGGGSGDFGSAANMNIGENCGGQTVGFSILRFSNMDKIQLKRKKNKTKKKDTCKYVFFDNYNENKKNRKKIRFKKPIIEGMSNVYNITDNISERKNDALDSYYNYGEENNTYQLSSYRNLNMQQETDIIKDVGDICNSQQISGGNNGLLKHCNIFYVKEVNDSFKKPTCYAPYLDRVSHEGYFREDKCTYDHTGAPRIAGNCGPVKDYMDSSLRSGQSEDAYRWQNAIDCTGGDNLCIGTTATECINVGTGTDIMKRCVDPDMSFIVCEWDPNLENLEGGDEAGRCIMKEKYKYNPFDIHDSDGKPSANLMSLENIYNSHCRPVLCPLFEQHYQGVNDPTLPEPNENFLDEYVDKYINNANNPDTGEYQNYDSISEKGGGYLTTLHNIRDITNDYCNYRIEFKKGRIDFPMNQDGDGGTDIAAWNPEKPSDEFYDDHDTLAWMPTNVVQNAPIQERWAGASQDQDTMFPVFALNTGNVPYSEITNWPHFRDWYGANVSIGDFLESEQSIGYKKYEEGILYRNYNNIESSLTEAQGSLGFQALDLPASTHVILPNTLLKEALSDQTIDCNAEQRVWEDEMSEIDKNKCRLSCAGLGWNKYMSSRAASITQSSGINKFVHINNEETILDDETKANGIALRDGVCKWRERIDEGQSRCLASTISSKSRYPRDFIYRAVEKSRCDNGYTGTPNVLYFCNNESTNFNFDGCVRQDTCVNDQHPVSGNPQYVNHVTNPDNDEGICTRIKNDKSYQPLAMGGNSKSTEEIACNDLASKNLCRDTYETDPGNNLPVCNAIDRYPEEKAQETHCLYCNVKDVIQPTGCSGCDAQLGCRTSAGSGGRCIEHTTETENPPTGLVIRKKKYYNQCAQPEDGYRIIRTRPDDDEQSEYNLIEECPAHQRYDRNDIGVCTSCINEDPEKPYRRKCGDLSCIECDVCPSTDDPYLDETLEVPKCSKDCSFVYNPATEQCEKCSGDSIAVEDAEGTQNCQTCPGGQYTLDGVTCIDNNACNLGRWACDNCNIRWESDDPSFWTDKNIDEYCCSDGLGNCNFMNVYQGSSDGRPSPFLSCPGCDNTQECNYGFVDMDNQCLSSCRFNNNNQEPQNGLGENGMCESRYEYCRPSKGEPVGDCCEEWRESTDRDDTQVFSRDSENKCLRISTCGNGILDLGSNYEVVDSISFSENDKELRHVNYQSNNIQFKTTEDQIVYDGDENIHKVFRPVDGTWCEEKYSKYEALNYKDIIYKNSQTNLYDPFLKEIRDHFNNNQDVKTPEEKIYELRNYPQYQCTDSSNQKTIECDKNQQNTEKCCFVEHGQCSSFNCSEYDDWVNKTDSFNTCYGEECDIFDLEKCCYYDNQKCSDMECPSHYLNNESTNDERCEVDENTNKCSTNTMVNNEGGSVLINEFCCNPKGSCEGGITENVGCEAGFQLQTERRCNGLLCEASDYDVQSGGQCCLENELCSEGLNRLNLGSASCPIRYHYDETKPCKDLECSSTDYEYSDDLSCCVENPTCGEVEEICPENYIRRNNGSTCITQGCDTYQDIELCCSQRETCAMFNEREDDICNSQTGSNLVFNEENYNMSCEALTCDKENEYDRNICCKSGCPEGQYLDNGLCKDCNRITDSNPSSEITCSNASNSRFRNFDVADNCENGRTRLRGTYKDYCSERQSCGTANICESNPGWEDNEDASTSMCSNQSCNFENEYDRNRCCIIEREYEQCFEESLECIDGVKCRFGRRRGQLSNGDEECFPEDHLHFEECGQDCISDETIKCMVGFVFDEINRKCIINDQNNFICSETIEGEQQQSECIGGRAVCKNGYDYNDASKSCQENDVINSCREGEYLDERYGCILEEVYEDKPTNYIFNSINSLDCKEGYKLSHNGVGQRPTCILDSGTGWECQRSSRFRNDEELCCDEIPSENSYECSSSPLCPSGNTVIDGECVSNNPDIRPIDCLGEWSPCFSDCKDSSYRIKQRRQGLGEPCKDESGNILMTGSKRPCRGLGACTKYDDKYCGANLENMIVEDRDKWMWKWNNESKRDSCDYIYTGELENCDRIMKGDKNTRNNCTRYDNMCMGNTNENEDINCYSRNLIPKENVYSIEKTGDHYETCCEEFDPSQIVKRRDIDQKQIESQKEILTTFGIKDANQLRELNKLLR